MKALVLYRSHFGNTKQVAETIAAAVKGSGSGADVRDLRRRLPDLSAYDAALVGAPTRMARVTRRAKRVLKALKKRGFTKPVAIFDTFGPIPTKPEELEKARKWLFPGAAGIMQALGMKLGLNIYAETLRCEVQGGLKGPLKDGELDKAAAFAKKFVSVVGK
jgi:flavodoxin